MSLATTILETINHRERDDRVLDARRLVRRGYSTAAAAAAVGVPEKTLRKLLRKVPA